MPRTEPGTVDLIHYPTGGRHSALKAAHIVDRLSALPELEKETRCLYERASFHLSDIPPHEVLYACPA